MTSVEELIDESIKVKENLKLQISKIKKAAEVIISTYKNKRKLVAIGNGGSAADAQHIVTELVCRFEKNRTSLPAIALTTNTSLLTAIGNDFSFNDVFSKQIESIVTEGDVLVAISTSGNSKNILEGVKVAKKQKAICIGLTGKTGGKLKDLVDICICVPSNNTARIQEAHILIIHIICKIIEEALFPS